MEKNSAKECAICHISWIDVFYLEGRGTDLTERPPAESAASEGMCFSCHNGSLVDSRERVWGRGRGHPVNKVVPPGSTIPKSLPLSRDGRMVCGTCHSAHGIPDRKRFEETIFLRVSDKNSELCLLCHRNRAGGTHAGNHSLFKKVDEKARRRIEELGGRFSDEGHLICESCHAAHGGTSDRMLVATDRNPDGKPGLCEACHGTHPVGEKKAGGPFSHPVGVVSPPGIPETWDDGAKMTTAPGGRILCITCHRPHNAVRDSALLVRPPGEVFCLRCHPAQSSVSGTNHDFRVIEPADRKEAEEPLKKWGACGPCHAVHGATGPGLFALPVQGDAQADALSRVCLSCHREGGLAQAKPIGVPAQSSHPVGRPAAKETRREGHPLFGMDGTRNGTLVSCATCHDVHRWDPKSGAKSPGKKVEGDASTSFLRFPGTPASSLCARCHPDKDLVRKTNHDAAVVPEIARGKPASLCGSCHRVHGAKGRPLWAWEIPVRAGADRTSQVCFSCHDERGMAQWRPDGWKGHPVGIGVPDRFPTGGLPIFRPDNVLAGAGNIMTCGTCHDPHRWDPVNPSNRPGKKIRGDASTSFLRSPDGRNSPLCRKCHAGKETIERTLHDPVAAPQIRQGESRTLCGGCHVVHGAKGARMWPKELPGRDGYDPVSGLCLSCHGAGGMAKARTTERIAHPVGKEIPERMDNAGLPLYEGPDNVSRGKVLSCATCHDVHRWDPSNPSNRPGKKAGGSGATDFLRKPAAGGSPLCGACHGAQRGIAGTRHDLLAFPPKTAASASAVAPPMGICSPCHSVHDARQARLLWARDAENVPSPDPVRPYCRSCHRKGGIAGEKIIDDPLHPSGVPWKGPSISLPLSLSPDGKEKLVTCSTCHDLHKLSPQPTAGSGGKAPERSVTRLPMQGVENLCAVCHAKQSAVAETPHDRRKMVEWLGPPSNKEQRAGLCAPCHSVHAPSRASVLWAGPLGDGDDEMTRFCTGCHLDPKLLRKKTFFLPRHPQDVYITNRGMGLRERKADFPLFDKNGRRQASGVISCPTCHNPHQWDSADPSLKPAEGEQGSPVNVFLRNKGANFGICSECHSIRSILLYKNYHDPREWKKSRPAKSGGPRSP